MSHLRKNTWKEDYSRHYATQGLSFYYSANQPLIRADESLLHTDESLLHTDESLLRADESFVHADQRFLRADEPFVHVDQSLLRACERFVHADQPFRCTASDDGNGSDPFHVLQTAVSWSNICAQV